jgi:hypothetical protein
MALLEQARLEHEPGRQIEIFAEAEAAFRVFLRESPRHSSTGPARIQLGNLLTEQARIHARGVRGAERNEQLEARRLYEQAYEAFDKAAMELAATLSEIRPIVDPADREATARRERLRGEYLQAQLLMAAVLEESAETYESGDADQKQVLAKAAEQYSTIYKKHRSRLAGVYARFFQSRCFKKQGKYKEALGNLGVVLELPDQPAPLTALKTKALNLMLECCLDDSQKEYRRALDSSEPWLREFGARNPDSPDWLELRFRTAQAHWLLAASTEDTDAKEEHRERAERLAEHAAQREGVFRQPANKLLTEIRAN